MAIKREHIVAFQKMTTIEGKRDTLWRKDSKGQTVYRGDYKKHSSEYGWDLDKKTGKAIALLNKK